MLALLLAACVDKPADTSVDDTASSTCPGAPAVSITSPADNSAWIVGDDVPFDGAGTSYVDESLQFLWAVDGDVTVVGASGNWTPDAAGTYLITFQAQDSCGLSQATVHVTVDDPVAADTSATVYGADAGVPAGTWKGLSVAPDGELWGAMSGGLVRFDPVTEAARVYGMADGLLTDSPTAVLAASDDTLWVGHVGTVDRQGEHVSVGDDGALSLIEPIDYTESAEIQDVFRLAEQPYGVGVGDVWMGTNEGLCVHDADIGVFSEHAHPTHPHGYTLGVAMTPDGDVWNGDDYQLSRWRYSNDGDLSPSADLAETIPTWPVAIEEPIAITDLAADGDTLWVTSSLFGVARLTVSPELASSTVELLGAPFPTTASAVRVDNAGNTWIGSTTGLFVYAGGVLTALAGDWLPADGVEQIAVDDHTAPPTVWLGTSAGLVKLVGVPTGGTAL